MYLRVQEKKYGGYAKKDIFGKVVFVIGLEEIIVQYVGKKDVKK